MSTKQYRSANGKRVDMGQLMLTGEHTIAVGNMNVNARGDIVNTKTQNSIQTRAETVNKQYRNQTISSNVSDEPINSTIPDQFAIPVKVSTAPIEVETTGEFDEKVFSEIPMEDIKTGAPEVAEASGGLSAAIARSKAIKQEPLPNPKLNKKVTRI